MLELTVDGGDVVLRLKVVPKASRDRIVGELDGALKIAVSAPPEHGAANAAVCKLLAKSFGVRTRQVTITAGHGSPHKTVRIRGITAEDVHQLLERES